MNTIDFAKSASRSNVAIPYVSSFRINVRPSVRAASGDFRGVSSVQHLPVVE